MILETIIKWAIPFILGTVVTGISGYIKNKISREKEKDEEDKKENVAIKEAVQALLRNELIRSYREYEIKGELSILDKENIEAMYKQYKNLGGNGTVEKLYDELLDLHTKIIK